jgi:hypothetical protein
VDGLERSAALLLPVLRNVINQPDNARFHQLTLKGNEAAQRALVRPLGALALLRLCGWQTRDDAQGQPAQLLLPAQPLPAPAHLTAMLRAAEQLQAALARPLTDVAQRLATVGEVDLALYGAQELLSVVAVLRMQSNTITRRIDLGLPYNSRIRPHAALHAVATEVLRFGPDPKNARQLMREEYLSPAELDYLRNLERDLKRWLEQHGAC